MAEREPTSRNPSSRDAPSRLDTSREIPVRQISPVQPNTLPIGLAATALGAGLLFAGHRGGSTFTRLFSRIGDEGRAIARRFVPLAEHVEGGFVVPAGLSNVYQANQTRRYPFRATPDLAEELKQIYAKVSPFDRTVGVLAMGPGGQNFNQVHEAFLRAKYLSTVAPPGMERLTVNDILNNPTLRGQFSGEAIDLLERARATGMVHGSLPVSRGLTGLYKSGGNVLDTQWMKPIRIFDRMHAALRQFHVLGDLRPADLFFGAIRPFITKTEHGTVGNRMLLPNGIRSSSFHNFVLGSKVYGFNVEQGGFFEELASGIRAFDQTVPGTQHVGRAAAAMSGQLHARAMGNLPNGPPRNFFSRMLWRFERATGVGPDFQTQKSIPGEIWDFYQNLHAGAHGRTWTPSDYTKRSDQMGFFEKLANRVARGEDADVYFSESVVNNRRDLADLSFWERVKAYAGRSPHGRFFNTPPGTVGRGTPSGVVPNPRTPATGRTLIPLGANPRLGPRHTPSFEMRASSVVVPEGSAPHLAMHHLTERMNTLLGAGFGIGFAPTPGKWGWLGSAAKLYGVYYGAQIGLDWLKYADYLAGEATGGTRPSDMALSAYAKAMTLRQSVREAIGIQPTAKYMEELMPGSWSSPLSWIARTIGPIAAGGWSGRPGGWIAGLIGSFYLGGSDVEQTSGELARIYSGEQNIPVRKGRWWALGLQPWGGGEIERWQQHWIPRYQSKYRYTDAQYGSMGEYFAYESPAPTPHNLFGLTKLLSPDHYSEKHYLTRPYPYSTSGARMHAGEDMAPAPSRWAKYAADAGFPVYGTPMQMGSDPTTWGSQAGTTLDWLSEMTGIYKFFLENMPFYNDLVPGGGPGARNTKAARASTITSTSREFYDESYGGLLGYTELLRRFLDPEHGQQGVNYIPNTMPEWLPGSRSEFNKDREYFIDFSVGDPYARIPLGEARLPGPGYEALRPLHSNTPGVYDAMDRFLILADVAPYSKAYEHYKTIVEMWSASGALDSSWTDKFARTKEEVNKKVLGDQFSPRRFSGVRSGTLEELASANLYSPVEKAVGAAWEVMTHDVPHEIAKAVPLYGTILDAKLIGQKSAYEHFMAYQVYGTEFQNWSDPYGAFIRPRLNTLHASNPLTAMTGGAALGYTLLGGSPMGLTLGLASGATMGLLATKETLTPGPYIPKEYQERGREEQYFDTLDYIRFKQAAERARQGGNVRAAIALNFKAQATAVGMDYDAPYDVVRDSARFRMGTPMKDYAWTFLQAPPESRAAIMQFATPQAKPMLSAVWARQGDKRFRFRPAANADYMASRIVEPYGLPDQDWEGWSPEVPLDVIKVRTLDTVKNIAYDMHKYNLWASDRQLSDTAYSMLPSAVSSFPNFNSLPRISFNEHRLSPYRHGAYQR